VQCNEFSPQKILAWRNAFGNGNRLHTLIRDQAIDAPFCAVERVLGNLIVTIRQSTSPYG
jgi:hypothetical protein